MKRLVEVTLSSPNKRRKLSGGRVEAVSGASESGNAESWPVQPLELRQTEQVKVATVLKTLNPKP